MVFSVNTPQLLLCSLLRILRKERETIGQIRNLGLSAPQAIDLLTHEAIMLSQAGSRVVDDIFDASDRPEGGDVIMWWNDLEKDSRSVVYPLYVLYSLHCVAIDMPVGHPHCRWYAASRCFSHII